MTEREMAARTGPMTLPQPGLRGGGRHRAARAARSRPPLTIAVLLVLALIVLVLAVAALGTVT